MRSYFTSALAIAGLLALTLSTSAQAQGTATFLGRELESVDLSRVLASTQSKKDQKGGRNGGKDGGHDGGKDGGHDGGDGGHDGDHFHCNGTVAGYTIPNGTYINCTFDNGTLINNTHAEGGKDHQDGGKDHQDGGQDSNPMPWTAANAILLIKTVQTPIFTAQLVSGSKTKYTIGYGHTDKDVKQNQVITIK
jgi:hypothetical protein